MASGGRITRQSLCGKGFMSGGSMAINTDPPDPDALFSPMLVPFVIPPEIAGNNVLRWRESSRSQTRALVSLAGFLAMLALAGLWLVLGTTLVPGARHLPLLGGAGGLLLGAAVLLTVALGIQLPQHELEYDTIHCRLRVRTWKGKGRSRNWDDFEPGEWVLVVQRVSLRSTLRNGSPDWHGHACVVYAGRHRVPLTCSRSRERVLRYVASLPVRVPVVDQDVTLIGRAMFGGNLIG